MATNKIYKKDIYCKIANSKVINVSKDTHNTYITLEDTIFFPEGGGQSSDIGNITYNDEILEIIHVSEGEFPIHTINTTATTITKGDVVTLHLNWDHRFNNMQRHCGEHILSGAIYRLFGGINKGFHMGKDYMTIDIEFPKSNSCPFDKNKIENYDRITWDMAIMAEKEANYVIWQNLPVTIDYFDTRDTAEKYPLRKPLAFDTDISIATIGDISSPKDCVACCGSHPSLTGEVGMIKIYKIEPNKGMSRIYFDAGKQAFSAYQKQFDTLYDMGILLSCGYSDLVDKYKAQLIKQEKHNSQLTALRKSLTSMEVNRLIPILHPGMVEYYKDFSTDDLINIGKKLSPFCTGIIALVNCSENTAIIISSGKEEQYHCGKKIKSSAYQLGGKGGGSKNFGKAVFQNIEDLNKFLKTL